MSNENKVTEFNTLKKIVDQLKSCDYECEAGTLKNNVAFIALERMAEAESKNNLQINVTVNIENKEDVETFLKNIEDRMVSFGRNAGELLKNINRSV